MEPAFPVHPHINTAGNAGNAGMTLRDYFAAKAMQGWLASFDGDSTWPSSATRSMAEDFYKMADAMLEAREAV